MSLITCTECGKEFSDKASACPNCGCPTEEILSEINSINNNAEYDSGINTGDTVDPILLELHQKYPINPEHAVKEYMERKGISKSEAKNIINEYYRVTPPPRFREYWEKKYHPQKKGLLQAMADMQKEADRQQQQRQWKKEEKQRLKCPNCKSHDIDLWSNTANMKVTQKTSLNLNPLQPFTPFNTKTVKKEKTSMGKVALGVMTGGASLLVTGTKKKEHNEYYCRCCGHRWIGK